MHCHRQQESTQDQTGAAPAGEETGAPDKESGDSVEQDVSGKSARRKQSAQNVVELADIAAFPYGIRAGEEV